MVDLSVIVVSYNTCPLLRECLASIPAGCAGLAVETIVVDNASTDGSPDMVATRFPAVRLIRSAENRGFAYANNVGLEAATGRYMLLLNSDTIVHQEALGRLVEFMDRTPAAGYCGPRLCHADGSHQPSARRFPTPLSAAYSLLGLAAKRPFSRHVLDLHASFGDGAPFRADWLCGAALLVRAAAADQVGPLDDGFFLYFEETDWCKRMAAAGWEGWYVPAAEITHLGGGSVVREGDVRPFSGDHPAHWVHSSRRYYRRHHGRVGRLIADFVQVTLYALIWLRHRLSRTARSHDRARWAAASVRYLLRRGSRRKPEPSRTG